MLQIRNGDYVPDGTGGLRRAYGREDLLEGCAVSGNRVLYVQYFSHDAGADQLLEAMAQALCAP